MNRGNIDLKTITITRIRSIQNNIDTLKDDDKGNTMAYNFH